MNKKNQKDKLLMAFKTFEIKGHETHSTTGGTTDGFYGDDDGCTAGWFDLPGGGYRHTDDYTTCN
jgi:hypothetical protein